MSLLRTAGHMAVASSVHGRVQRRQSQRWAAQSRQVEPPPPPIAPPPAPAAVDPAQRIALLRELADLHAAGVLTDDEFAAQKTRLLG